MTCLIFIGPVHKEHIYFNTIIFLEFGGLAMGRLVYMFI